MWIVTTADGREYRYGSLESAVLAARERFGGEGYTITNEDEGIELKSKYRGKEK